MRSVAIDVGGKKICFCEVSNGQVVQRATVQSLESLKSLLGPDQPTAQVGVEACREAWHAYELLSSWGNEVLLIDTTRSKQLGIGQHGRKTDLIDAEVLAKAVESGRVPKAHLLSASRRELRRLLGIRRNLVEARAQFVVTARGLAQEQGVTLPTGHTESFSAKVNSSHHVPREMKELLQPLLISIQTLNEQIEKVESQLDALGRAEPTIQLLCTAPGVGPLVAATFVSVVDEARRFKNAHQLESYLGLVPSENSSGSQKRVGGITKKGNSYLRSVLMQSAWVVVRKRDATDPLVRWANEVVKRRGKKVGVVAVARKLAGILWAMWKRNEVYDAELLRAGSVRGLQRQAQDTLQRASSLREASRKTTGKFSVREVHL